MTKDGFTFLVMGYTGSLAAHFKEKYIAAFNEIEAKANAAVMALPDFSNPVLAARAWADEVEQKQALQRSKLDGFDQIRLPLTVGGPRVATYRAMPLGI